MSDVVEFNHALKQNVDVIADRVRDLAETPWLVAPTTDAERSAFVKKLARAALDLGVQDAHASVRSDSRIGAPASVGEPKTTTAEPWYRVTVWLCGAPEVVCCRVALTPLQFVQRIYAEGLTIELSDGGIDSFKPASDSRVRVEVYLTKPPGVLCSVVFKAKRGAK